MVDHSDMPLCDPSVFVDKYRHRYAPNSELFCNAVFPSDRKGDLEGLHELAYVVITAQDKDADEFNALVTE